MGKRFKSLRKALDYLKNTGVETDTIPAAPVGSQLEYFQKWDSNQREVNYVRAADSKPGQIKEAAIKPFAVSSGSTEKIIVAYSKRASDSATTCGVNTTLLHEANLTGASRKRGFEPAQAIVTIVGTGTDSETSKLTGRKYTKKGNKSYTFPFGQGTGTGGASYASRKADFVTATSGGTGNKTVSFNAEVYP